MFRSSDLSLSLPPQNRMATQIRLCFAVPLSSAAITERAWPMSEKFAFAVATTSLSLSTHRPSVVSLKTLLSKSQQQQKAYHNTHKRALGLPGPSSPSLFPPGPQHERENFCTSFFSFLFFLSFFLRGRTKKQQQMQRFSLEKGGPGIGVFHLVKREGRWIKPRTRRGRSKEARVSVVK